MSPEAALAVCRFVHDGAAMLLWGCFAYLAALVPRDLGRAVGQSLQNVRLGAIAAAALTTLAALPIEVASIGDGWADAVDPVTVGAVLLDTSVGRAWMVQAIAAALLVATLGVPLRLRAGATAALSGLVLATLPLTGHASMHEGLRGVLHRGNDALHVLAGGAWLGALLPLGMVLRMLGDPFRRGEAAVALRRFSTVGHAAVALVIATGIVNTVLILGGWPLDWSSRYQALLAIKIGLVLLMTVLALVNRYGVVPRMALNRSKAVAILGWGTLVEAGLGLAVLGCVSVFGLLDPT